MTAPDLFAALEPVVAALETLGVRYYIGGSLASSTHGVPRASIDADVIAELDRARLAPFLTRLAGDYYFDQDRARAAVDSGRAFNLIHLATMFKVDLFVARRRPFDRQALDRARPEPLEGAPEGRQFQVASLEDTVLAKLEWFRAGGEVSERQWTDVIGLLATGWSALDPRYLQGWAEALEVSDLLDRALTEAKPETSDEDV